MLSATATMSSKRVTLFRPEPLEHDHLNFSAALQAARERYPGTEGTVVEPHGEKPLSIVLKKSPDIAHVIRIISEKLGGSIGLKYPTTATVHLTPENPNQEESAKLTAGNAHVETINIPSSGRPASKK